MASAGMVANDLECTTGHRSNGYVGAFQGTTVQNKPINTCSTVPTGRLAHC